MSRFINTNLKKGEALNYSLFFVLIATLLVSDVRIPSQVSVSVTTIFATALIISTLASSTLKELWNFTKAHKIYCLLGVGLLFTFFLKACIVQSIHGWGIFIEWFLIPAGAAFSVGLLHVRNMTLSEKVFHLGIMTLLGGILASSTVYLLYDISTWDGRFHGLLPSPNHLALLLAPVMAYGVVFALSERNHMKKAATLLLALLLTPFLAMTESLGAIVALAMALVISATYALVSGKRKQKILLGGIIAVVTIAVLTPLLFHKINSAYASPDRSPLASRMMIWQASIDLIRESPAVGIELGEFQREYLAAQEHYKPYLEWSAPLPHNTFLAMWLYGGIAGLAFFLFVLMWSVHTFTQLSKLHKQKTLPLMAALLVMILHGLIDTAYFRIDLAMLFWLVVIILITKKI